MTKPTKISLDKLLEEVRGKCQGRCYGTGADWAVESHACPEPCTPDLLRFVKEGAQDKARSEAQEWCKEHGEYCACLGELHEFVPPQCVQIKKADGSDACLYFAAYIYRGECRILI